MSGQTFHKILCGKCAGKIEFPAEYAGQTIPCPHCQTLVLLKTPPADPAEVKYDYPDPASLTPEEVTKGHKAKWSVIYTVAVLVGINLVMGILFLLRSKSDEASNDVTVTSWKMEPGEYRTYYVTGVLSNSTSKAIAKARVEFETLDNVGAPSGKVSAVISNIEPNGLAAFSVQTSATQTVWDAKVLGVFIDKN
jgi:DNA-directed RNA polymerase subunit RPC12/RpoP